MNTKDELKIAKKAAFKAGKILINNKNSLNKLIFSSDRDIKLQADIYSEKIIIDILSQDSDFPILAEESLNFNDELAETFWVVDRS